MKIVSKSLGETEKVAKSFLEYLKGNTSQEGAQIVGLFGDLGAGKTAFTQAVARLLGVRESVTSPTFVIMKIYDLEASAAKASPFNKLIHVDAYRLERGEELMKLNFANIAADPKNLILIEWPENVASALPKQFYKIFFKFVDENTREVELPNA